MIRLLTILCWIAVSLTSLSAQERAADDYAFAAGLHDRGLHERAVRSFEQFLRNHGSDPRAAKAAFYLGQSRAELGRNGEALEAFEQYLSRGEEELRPQALLRAGELYQLVGKPKRAIERLEALIRHPKAGDTLEPAHYFLGEAATAAGDPKKARAAFSHLVKTWPAGSYVAWSQLALGYQDFQDRRFKDALRSFRAADKKARRREPELAVEARVMVGETLIEMEEFRLADELFQSLDSRSLGAFAAQANLGAARAALGMGETDTALRRFRRHAEKHADDPRLTRTLLRSAALLHEKGDGATGLKLIRLVKNARGQDAEDLAFWSGRLLESSGDSEAALKELKVAAATSPKRKFSYGDALSRAGRFDDAARVFAELARDEGQSEIGREAAFAGAFALYRKGRFEAAIKALRPLAGQELGADLKRDVYFALGENHFALKQYKSAEKWFQRILDEGKGKYFAESLYKAGWCAWSLKRPEDARRALKAFVAEDPNGPLVTEALYLIAKAHEAEGNHDQAGEVFRRVAASGSNSDLGAKARLGEAAALRRDGKPAEAADKLEEALAKPHGPELAATLRADLGHARFAAGEFNAARRAFDAFLKKHEGHARVPEIMLARAWALREDGKKKDAAGAALEAAAANDEAGHRVRTGEARYLAGLCFQEIGKEAEALAPLEGLVTDTKHPRRSEGLLLLGVSRARTGDFSGAIEPLELAARIKGLAGRDVALYELAFCHKKSEAPAKSEEIFRRLIKEHGKSPLAGDASFRLGESLYEREEFEKALADYRVAFEHPETGALKDKAAYKGAWCLRQLDRSQEAAQAFDAVSKMKESPLAAESIYLAAEAFEKCGEDEKAVERLTTFLEQHKKHEHTAAAAARRLLAWHRLGETRKVVRFAPGFLERHGELPQSVHIWSALGDALRADKKPARARVAYGKVVDRSEGPLGARAQFFIGRCLADEGDVDRAIDEMLKVDILWTQKEWAARAMADAATLLDQQGKAEKAKKLRRDILRDYPDSPEAKSIDEKSL